MSFREKMTWVMTVATLAASWVYFVPMIEVVGQAGFIAPASAALGLGAVIILVMIAVAGIIISALSNVREADAPLDERERKIAQQGEAVGAFVLGGGVMGLIVAAHMLALADWLVPALVAALVASQLATFAVQLFLYRRA